MILPTKGPSNLYRISEKINYQYAKSFFEKTQDSHALQHGSRELKKKLWIGEKKLQKNKKEPNLFQQKWFRQNIITTNIILTVIKNKSTLYFDV